MKDVHYLVSCEHASNRVPKEFSWLFSKSEEKTLLRSHRAYDQGALEVAEDLAKILKAPLFVGEFSRLLIDLNRSPGHAQLFSSWSKQLDSVTKDRLLEQHQHHHNKLRSWIKKQKPGKQVRHIAVHSFTPLLVREAKQNGQSQAPLERTTQIGLLYDPARQSEKSWVQELQSELQKSFFPVHRNQPYRGVSDGLCTLLRKEFSGAKYAGIELELNQSLCKGGKSLQNLRQSIAQSFSGQCSSAQCFSG